MTELLRLGQDPTWLSYPLSTDTPAYGGGEGLSVSPITSIAAGDTANTLQLRFPNHLGTHVDLPAHFFEAGPTLDDYQATDWVFNRPMLVDVDTESGALVDRHHIEGRIPDETDLLLIRTGHGRNRGTPGYWEGGPGLSPDLALWLRDACPDIRAVGMDLISVTSRLRREAGRAAHRAFLDPAGVGRPIRLIEDMRLYDCPTELRWVLVSPLSLRGADGAPVTVWGFQQA